MRAFLKACKHHFINVGVFSFFMNLLMLTMPIYMITLFQRVLTSRSMETLVLLTIAALGALFLYMILDILRSRVLLGAGITLDGLAGPKVLKSVISSIVRPGTDQYTSGLRDVGLLRNFITGTSITSLFDSPWVPIFLFVIYMFHPLLGAMATIGAVTLFLLAFINDRVTRNPINETSAKTARATRYIDSGFRNVEVINALGMTEDLTRKWLKLNHEMIDSQVEATKLSNMISSISRFVRLIIQILMLAVGASLVIRQEVTPGIMIAGTLILSRALAPVESAIHTWRGLVDARGAYRRLNELLVNTEREEKINTVSLPKPKGRLSLENVSFGISGSDRMILKGVSFQLEAGESLGLIGPSAAGKSTSARLITGIWRPIGGTVRLDGADVSTWRRQELGKYIGYLPQDIELFEGTVGDNIARLGDVDSEEIIAAAKRAKTHEMIMRLPNAYDTNVGEGGVTLSTGQRQRIALARALFGEPSFVILDEPNANLDSDGELALVACLNDLKQQGVTTVTVSHRPSLLSNVDKLLLLKDGKVEMFGPRQEVMNRVTSRAVKSSNPGPNPVSAVADRS